MNNNKIKTILLAFAFAFPVMASCADNPVSGRIGSQSLTERGLTDAADGRFDDADDNLSAALKSDPSDSKAAEGLLALRLSRGDAEGGREAAMALLRFGSPRQAVAAAEVLSPLGYDALPDMFQRQDVLDYQASAEWLVSKLVSQARWGDAKRMAILAIGKYPRSWRLSISHATALGMIDSAESAEAALRDAKENGAPQEALAAASRVVSSAGARKKLSDELVRKTEADAPIKRRVAPVAQDPEPVRAYAAAPVQPVIAPTAATAPVQPTGVRMVPLPQAPATPAAAQGARFKSGKYNESVDGDILF